MKKSGARNILIIGGSVFAMALTIAGAWLALRSPLFLVRAIEIEDPPLASSKDNPEKEPPVDADTIAHLAAVPVGKINLFALNLTEIENRILSNEWIRQVTIQKRFPQTVSIGVVYRDPKALLQLEHGALAYVDADGHVFGKISLAQARDLPIFSGVQKDSKRQILDALNLLDAWNKAPVGEISQISAISYSTEQGFSAVITYPFAQSGRGRAVVDIGNETSTEFEAQLSRIHQVLRYLIANRIAARQISADSGKKIVVKIAHGS